MYDTSGNGIGGGIGGGMYNVNSNPTPTNCILWDDDEPWPQIVDEGSGTTTATYCIIRENWTSIGPLFVDADGLDNVHGTADDDLRLTPTLSPGIDAGNNAAVPPDTDDLDGDGDTTEPIPFDISGAPRFIDDPIRPDIGAGDAPVIDIGAYECQSSITTGSADLDGDGDVDLVDFGLFQQQFAGPQ